MVIEGGASSSLYFDLSCGRRSVPVVTKSVGEFLTTTYLCHAHGCLVLGLTGLLLTEELDFVGVGDFCCRWIFNCFQTAFPSLLTDAFASLHLSKLLFVLDSLEFGALCFLS